MQAGGPAKGTSKLKIIIKTPQSHATGQEDTVDDGTNGAGGVNGAGGDEADDFFTAMSQEQGFTPDELETPLPRLHGLCRMQVKWAEAEGEQLKKECKAWEDMYKKEWLEKQVLLAQVIESEIDWHERRKAVLSGVADVQIKPEVVINAPAESPEPPQVV